MRQIEAIDIEIKVFLPGKTDWTRCKQSSSRCRGMLRRENSKGDERRRKIEIAELQLGKECTIPCQPYLSKIHRSMKI